MWFHNNSEVLQNIHLKYFFSRELFITGQSYTAISIYAPLKEKESLKTLHFNSAIKIWQVC